MIRSLALAAVLALAAAAPFASTADAGKHKLCKATTLQGKNITFKCKTDEKCCYNKLLNEKSCGSKAGILGLGVNVLCL